MEFKFTEEGLKDINYMIRQKDRFIKELVDFLSNDNFEQDKNTIERIGRTRLDIILYISGCIRNHKEV